MTRQTEFSLPSFGRGFHLITDIVLNNVGTLPGEGIMHLFIRHTSAGLTINENADPSVTSDLETIFNLIVPEGLPQYRHTIEGADDMPAHVKASLVGHSVTVPIIKGRLGLGIWQGIFLCEFRNRGGRRNIVATIYS